MHLNYFRKKYTNIKYMCIYWYILICIYVKLIKHVSIWILKILSGSYLAPNALFCPVLQYLSPLKLSPQFFYFSLHITYVLLSTFHLDLSSLFALVLSLWFSGFYYHRKTIQDKIWEKKKKGEIVSSIHDWTAALMK